MERGRLGGRGGVCATGCRSAGSPGAAWRSPSRTRRSPAWPPSGGAPLVTFAVALSGGLLAQAAVAWRRWPGSWLAPSLRCWWRSSGCWSRGRPTVHRSRSAVVQGNVPAHRHGRLRPRACGARQPRRARPCALASDVAARPVAAAGPRGLAGELLRRRPVRRRGGQGSRSSSAAAGDRRADPGRHRHDDAGRPEPAQHRRRLGPAAPGPGAVYVKRHPVPFGEYVPFRSPAVAVRLAGCRPHPARTTLPGTRARGAARSTAPTVGDVICFEVAYDDVVRDVVTRRRPADRRADQQRHVRPHRPGRAAVRDHPAARGGARPRRRGGRDQRDQRRDRARRHGDRSRRPEFVQRSPGPGRCRSGPR